MRYALTCLLMVTMLAVLSAPASADESAFAGYWDGAIKITLNKVDTNEAFKIRVRIPGWCSEGLCWSRRQRLLRK